MYSSKAIKPQHKKDAHMNIEILAKKTTVDVSSKKSWKPENEFLEGYLEHEEVISKLTPDAQNYAAKSLEKLRELIIDHNNHIRQIGSVRKHQKLVELIRTKSDALEAEIVMHVEILNVFLDKADKETKKSKRKAA